MTSQIAPDAAQIKRTIAVLHGDAAIVELRAIHKGGRKRVDAGYFDGEHRGLLVEEAMRLNGQGAAVYITLNELDSQLLARHANRVQEYAPATATDANVIHRHWLLIDIDPQRPKDTSATNEQLAVAMERAQAVYDILSKRGWPKPASADSGNGLHFLYRVNLPNDEDSRELVKNCLTALAIRFNDDTIKIDQSVFNAARIIKLHGTVANKGDNLPTAPWRLSKLRAVPADLQPVPIEVLRALAAEVVPVEQKPNARIAGIPAWSEADVQSFFARGGIDAVGPDQHEGASRWKLKTCPFNPDHGFGEAAVFLRLDGRLGFECRHDSCQDKHWRDLRTLVDGDRGPSRLNHRAVGPLGIDNSRPFTPPPPVAIEEVSRVISRRMSDVVAQPIKWLWPGRIARGKVTVIAGHPGLGKSQLTANLASIVTTGGRWPDGSRCELGSVLMVSGEDDAADTIRPRLECAGSDLTRVHILDGIEEVSADGEVIRRAFNLKSDLGRLETLLADLGDIRMLSVDPITAYLGDTDSHKNADVRALLAPLADLAGRYGAAIIGVSHLSKAGGQKALLRVSGSLAFVAAARAAYLVASDEEQEGRRLMLPLKNNIGPDQTGFSFKIESIRLGNGIDTSRIVWDSTPVTVTADDVLSAESSQSDDRNALEEAKDFLCEMLANGPVEGKVIYRQADDAGHSKRTIDRAKRDLGIRSTKAAMTGPWRWDLPTKTAKDSEDCHEKVTATFGDVGNLRPMPGGPMAGIQDARGSQNIPLGNGNWTDTPADAEEF